MGGIKARLTAKQLAHSVPIESNTPITVGQFTGLDVENPWGDVTIDADSDNEFAIIEFRVRKERWLRFQMARQGVEFDPVGEYFTAQYINPEGSMNQVGTLVIRPTALDIDGFRPPIDLKITLPRCDGARVVTSRGDVWLTGVTGIVSVLNGGDDAEGGDIVIRANEEGIEELFASTSSGNVFLVSGPSGSGVFDIRAPRGDAYFRSRYGVMDEVIPSPGRWSGVWNEGSNPFSLVSEDGDAAVYVVEKPTMFKP